MTLNSEKKKYWKAKGYYQQVTNAAGTQMLQIYGKLRSPPGVIYKSDTRISWMMGKKKVS